MNSFVLMKSSLFRVIRLAAWTLGCTSSSETRSTSSETSSAAGTHSRSYSTVSKNNSLAFLWYLILFPLFGEAECECYYLRHCCLFVFFTFLFNGMRLVGFVFCFGRFMVVVV